MTDKKKYDNDVELIKKFEEDFRKDVIKDDPALEEVRRWKQEHGAIFPKDPAIEELKKLKHDHEAIFPKDSAIEEMKMSKQEQEANEKRNREQPHDYFKSQQRMAQRVAESRSNEVRQIVKDVVKELQNKRGASQKAQHEQENIVSKGEKIYGWKDIANELGVSERAAKNYAEKKGLPVKKTEGKVWAWKSELTDWQIKKSRKKSK